ncbi:MAG: hypothetical protein Q8942_11810 [Bacillota bacterium]|nr:hypothetical protein [Bacillota bacterium]
MIRSKSSRALTLLLLIPFTFLFVGCGSKNNKQTPQQQSVKSEQSMEEPPKVLTSLEDNIETIITALDGPSAPKEEKTSQGGAPSGSTGSDENKKSGKSGSQSGGDNKDQGGQSSPSPSGSASSSPSSSASSSPSSSPSPSGSESTPSPKGGNAGNGQASPSGAQKKDPWSQITPVINSLHYQWNELSPQVSSKGAVKELTDNFSTALNNLTNDIITKDKQMSLMASNSLYSYIPDFYYLYKSKTSPEIKRVKYYTRNSALNSSNANWTQATSDINNLKASWSTYKNTSDKSKRDNVNKLDYSISELEKVIKEKNQPLINIKASVVLANINSLEKASESQSS